MILGLLGGNMWMVPWIRSGNNSNKTCKVEKAKFKCLRHLKKLIYWIHSERRLCSELKGMLFGIKFEDGDHPKNSIMWDKGWQFQSTKPETVRNAKVDLQDSIPIWESKYVAIWLVPKACRGRFTTVCLFRILYMEPGWQELPLIKRVLNNGKVTGRCGAMRKKTIFGKLLVRILSLTTEYHGEGDLLSVILIQR